MKIRKLIITSLLILVLLAGLAIVWWFSSGENWVKAKVEASVTELSGRSFSIDGAFSLDLSANTVLIAENIRLSNPPWALNPDFARLDKLELSIELASVFSEPVRINFINMDGLVIALEQVDSGEKSWDFLSGPEQPSATVDGASTELPVSVGRISLADFSLLHESPGRKVPLDFHLGQLELSQEIDQHVQFTTDGQFGGEKFNVAGNLGPLDELITGGKIDHNIRLALGEIVLQSQGNIEQSSTLSGANINLTFSGPEFEWILSQLALPEFSHGDFDFNLNLRTEGNQTHLDLDGDLGSLEAKAQGFFNDLASIGTANLTAEISGDDLGSLLELSGVSGLKHNPFSLKLDISHAAGLFQLQTLELETGGNSLSVLGQVGDWPKLENTNLDFSLIGVDLSAWAPILKLDNLPVSAFSLNGGILPTDSGLKLESISLKLGGSQFVVDGTMGEAPGFAGTALSIEAAGPSLAEFRFLPGLETAPVLPFQIKGKVGKDDTGLTFDSLNLKLGENSLQLGGRLGLNEQLEGSSFTTRAIIPKLASLGPMLGLEGLPEQPLSVNGNYQRTTDGWTFQLSDGNFADATFESEGKYTDSNTGLQIEATSQVSAPDLAVLARFAGVEDLPGLPVNVKGFARYDAGKIELRDIQGNLGDSLFKITAKLVNPPTWSGSDISLSISGPDIDPLLVNRDVKNKLPFSLEGSIARDSKSIRISQVKTQLGLLQASADGVIGNLDDMSATDIQFAITSPSLQNIGELLDFPLPDEPFSLGARFKGSPSEFHAEQLEIKLGPSDLSGEVSVDLSAKPRVNGVLRSNYLDMAWLQREDKGDSSGKKSADTSKQVYLIPDGPIEYSRMDFADIDIDIAISELDFPQLTIRDFHTHTRIVDGDLFVDTFQVRGTDGGLLGGNMTVVRETDSDVTSIALSVEGHDFKLGIGAAEGQDPETIRQSEIMANLSGAGVTYRELAQSLNGHVEVVQGPGLTESAGLSLIFGDFIGELLNMLNPFAKTDKFIKNECAVTIINIESGVLTFDPMVSQSEKMTLVAKGAVDLHTEKIQFTFNTKLRQGIGISASMVVNPFVSITGTLASPIIGLDPAAVAVKGTVAVATVGLSLLAKSLSDRFFSSKDPCGDALKKSREQLENASKEGKNKK